MTDRKALGDLGERLALEYLKKRGYRIVERNFRTRSGEIDIIAREGDDLVFVEVKLRRSVGYGLPQEAVGGRKQEHLVKAALQFVKQRNLVGSNLRFDVLAIGPGPGDLEIIPSAFTAPSRYTC